MCVVLFVCVCMCACDLESFDYSYVTVVTCTNLNAFPAIFSSLPDSHSLISCFSSHSFAYLLQSFILLTISVISPWLRCPHLSSFTSERALFPCPCYYIIKLANWFELFHEIHPFPFFLRFFSTDPTNQPSLRLTFSYQ